jgi:ABC-type cobalamin/Fe3+-siderophores transport system ATPase subunit
MQADQLGYRVVFADSRRTIDQPQHGTIIVSPSKDSWNDFGFQVRVDLLIQPPHSHELGFDPLLLPGFFGFMENKRRALDVRALREKIAESGPFEAEQLPSYFTMLPDMATYRKIGSTLGWDEARRALRALHDIVEAEESPGIPHWLRSATESQLFRKAFLRTTESFFAWKNAGAILEGAEFERVGQLSEELRIRFRLAGRPNDHELAFRFGSHDAVLPKRFAVVIGKNGVGKSQTIGRIADAAMRGTDALTDQNGERPSFNRILAFYPSAVAGDAFPGERRGRSKVWYRRFSLGGAGYGRRRQTTADLIVELARNTEHIGETSRFQIFANAIKAIDFADELALVMRDFEDPVFPISKLIRGGEEQLVDRFGSVDPRAEVVRLVAGRTFGLSSGELSFVRFAALASLHIENSSLLLFDEPETHLHPAFISQFVSLLDNLLQQTGSAAIIATHSVYFVREAFEDQVHVLRSGPEREITVEPPVLRTFGADVGTISWFVFGEDEPSRLAQSVEERIAADASSWEEVEADYKEELSLDLLGEIRANIEDSGEGAAA